MPTSAPSFICPEPICAPSESSFLLPGGNRRARRSLSSISATRGREAKRNGLPAALWFPSYRAVDDRNYLVLPLVVST